MIFKQVLVDQILAGNKTMTRRRMNWGPWEEYPGGRKREAPPCRYKPGRSYAVQPGRGKKSVARIEVTAIWRERWCDITEDDAIREGFGPPEHSTTRWSARDEFLRYVHGLYGEDFDLTEVCWVIEFKLVDNREGK